MQGAFRIHSIVLSLSAPVTRTRFSHKLFRPSEKCSANSLSFLKDLRTSSLIRQSLCRWRCTLLFAYGDVHPAFRFRRQNSIYFNTLINFHHNIAPCFKFQLINCLPLETASRKSSSRSGPITPEADPRLISSSALRRSPLTTAVRCQSAETFRLPPLSTAQQVYPVGWGRKINVCCRERDDVCE